MEKSQELREVLLRYLDADLERIIFSNPRTRESYLKLTVRPLLLRGALAFQTEEFTEKQAFQKNQNAEKTAEYLLGELENRYRNAEIASLHGIVNILISKKGTVTIKEKKVGVKRAENRTVSVAAGDVQKAGKQMPAKSHADVKENSLEKSGQSQSSHENGKMQRSAKIQGNGKLQNNAKQQKNAGTGLSAGMDAAAFSERLASLSHNRTKKYVLQEGVPVPFDAELLLEKFDALFQVLDRIGLHLRFVDTLRRRDLERGKLLEVPREDVRLRDRAVARHRAGEVALADARIVVHHGAAALGGGFGANVRRQTEVLHGVDVEHAGVLVDLRRQTDGEHGDVDPLHGGEPHHDQVRGHLIEHDGVLAQLRRVLAVGAQVLVA